VSVRLPAVGEYGLEIYACNDAQRHADKYSHVCQYLVVFEHQLTSVDEHHQPLDQPRPTAMLVTPPSGDEDKQPNLATSLMKNVGIFTDVFIAISYCIPRHSCDEHS